MGNGKNTKKIHKAFMAYLKEKIDLADLYSLVIAEFKGRVKPKENNMDTFLKLIKSRQFWTLAVLFIINGVSGIREAIPVGVLPYIDGLLGMLVIYFRISPKQNFGGKPVD